MVPRVEDAQRACSGLSGHRDFGSSGDLPYGTLALALLIDSLELRVHGRAGGMRVKLYEELSDRLAAQASAKSCRLAGDRFNTLLTT
jgi:hypothetical protein